MKLSECRFGVIVENFVYGKVGMVVGITEYKTDYGTFPIPLVQWQDGTTCAANHVNLRLYEE